MPIRSAGLLAFVLCSATIAACAPSPDTPGAASEAAAETSATTVPPRYPIDARFACGELTLPVVFHDDHAVLTIDGRERELLQVRSASGARYSDGALTFWNKGNEATLELDGRARTCREVADPWQAARERGIDLRAVGQEPGWLLEIDRGASMRLVYDYAEREVVVPAPVSETDADRTTYSGRTETHVVTAVIEERPCADAMSGEAFPMTVAVTIDGRELRGCGRRLTPDEASE